jgi:hypothetical protein
MLVMTIVGLDHFRPLGPLQILQGCLGVVGAFFAYVHDANRL